MLIALSAQEPRKAGRTCRVVIPVWMKSPEWIIHVPHSIKDCTPKFCIAEARPFQKNCLRFLISRFLSWNAYAGWWREPGAPQDICYWRDCFLKEEIPSRKLRRELRYEAVHTGRVFAFRRRRFLIVILRTSRCF